MNFKKVQKLGLAMVLACAGLDLCWAVDRYVPYNSLVQATIDLANPGDRILINDFIAPGNIIINKDNITLEGVVDNYKGYLRFTFDDDNRYGVIVRANNVTIKNLTFEAASSSNCVLVDGVSNTIFYGCNFWGNIDGSSMIGVAASSANIVDFYNCFFFGFINGIYATNLRSRTWIEGCDFEYCNYGVTIEAKTSAGMHVNNTTFNHFYIGVDYIRDNTFPFTSYNYIENCHFLNKIPGYYHMPIISENYSSNNRVRLTVRNNFFFDCENSGWTVLGTDLKNEYNNFYCFQ